MDQKTNSQDQTNNTSPNLGLTLAPQDSLITTDQDKTTETTPTPQPPVENLVKETINSDSPSINLPQNWGQPTSTSPDSSPSSLSLSPVQPPKEDFLSSQLPKTETPAHSSSLSHFLKVFLISVALILLGILLGVISANFFQATSPKTAVVTPIETSPTLTEQITETLPPKFFEVRNSGEGVYSYDLSVPGSWDILMAQIEKGVVDLSFQKNDLYLRLFYNATESANTAICLSSAEVVPAKSNYLQYLDFTEISKGELSWRAVKDLGATESASYSVCEKTMSKQYNTLTSLGFITFGSNSMSELSDDQYLEIVQVLENIKMIDESSSSAVMKK